MSTAANPRANYPQQGGQEATGAVTSDSLAAESAKSGGGFAENDAAISSVKGSNSTFNTTDTSGATVLHAAEDGATREKQDAKGLGSDEKGVSGVKYDPASNADFSGTVSDQGYVGGSSNTGSGPKTTTGGTSSGATGDSFADGGAGVSSSSDTKTADISSGAQAADTSSGTQAADTSSETQAVDTSSGKKTEEVSSGSTATGVSGSTESSDLSGGTTSTGVSGSTSTKPSDITSGSGSTGQSSSLTDESSSSSGGNQGSGQGDTAPNYAGVVSGAIKSEGQDKVKGENLTEGDIPQTKTFTGNVGGDKDPGRLAEKDFQKVSAQNTASTGPTQYSGSGADSTTGGAFDALSSERAPDSSNPAQ